MATLKTETIQVTCDGCGRRTTTPEQSRGAWRTVQVTVSELAGGEQLRSRSVDLCDECLRGVHVPGIENG